jgi:hypothetical protein
VLVDGASCLVAVFQKRVPFTMRAASVPVTFSGHF